MTIMVSVLRRRRVLGNWNEEQEENVLEYSERMMYIQGPSTGRKRREIKEVLGSNQSG